jgi:Kef-type K+ transport system membrane component KefB
MNELLSVGLILMSALTAGHLAQLIRLPEVTGYLAIGMIIGPAGLDLITHDNLAALGILSEVALGLILFNIGSIFEASVFRQLGPGVMRVTLWEASLAFLLVTAALFAVGLPWPLAVLLGVVAMETAPATTLMVLNEYDAEGPMAERLLALVALNNTYVLISFGIVTALITVATPSSDSWMLTGYRALHGLAWTILGSVALGALVGVATDLWATRVKESGEAIILAAGVVLVTVGASRWLGVSPLIATLSLGATVANGSRRGDQLLKALRRGDPPLYAAFFVLAGAELVPGAVLTLGMAGAAYAGATAPWLLPDLVVLARRRADNPDSLESSSIRGNGNGHRPRRGPHLRGDRSAPAAAGARDHRRSAHDPRATRRGDDRRSAFGVSTARRASLNAEPRTCARPLRSRVSVALPAKRPVPRVSAAVVSQIIRKTTIASSVGTSAPANR